MRMQAPARVALPIAMLLAAAAASVGPLVLGETSARMRPVIFVHGMGASAARIGHPGGGFEDLLPEIARRYPRRGVCQRDAQAHTPWVGSPCVFRYVDDAATGGDSASGVEDNADKLAAEIAEVRANAGGQQVVVVGYSMGGAIIRAYLGMHRESAARELAGAVILDGAMKGSWVLAGPEAVGDVPALGPLAGALRRMAAGLAFGVDTDSPAARDLAPDSELMRRLNALPPPENLAYTTFWGDIGLGVRLPGDASFAPASIGDIVLVPGNQRFAPTPESLEVRHGETISLDAAAIRSIVAACALPLPPECGDTVGTWFDSPSAHWRLPDTLDDVDAGHPALGEGSLLDLVVAAVGR